MKNNHLPSETTLEEVLPLLAKRARKYTSAESTSVTNETARQILLSILYCLEETNASSTDLTAGTESVEQRFASGLKRKQQLIQDTKSLLEHIQAHLLPIEMDVYKRTILTGIPPFLQDYDVQFGAHLSPGSIDYQLCMEIEGLSGIDFMAEYLNRFHLEETFLSYFPVSVIREVLRGYHSDYENLLVNIFQIVFQNAIGCILCNYDIYELDIRPEARSRLYRHLSDLTRENIKVLLQMALRRLIGELPLENDEVLIAYLSCALDLFADSCYQYIQMGQLEHVFVTRSPDAATPAFGFEDGELMEDEQLRSFIDEMSECRHLSDKISMIREQIHSLSDLEEVLKECFWHDEFSQVFELLSPQETMTLQTNIKLKQDLGSPLEDWEKALSGI